jgi:hypothetical protein
MPSEEAACQLRSLLPRRPHSSRIAERNSRPQKDSGPRRRPSRGVDAEAGRLAPSIRSRCLSLQNILSVRRHITRVRSFGCCPFCFKLAEVVVVASKFQSSRNKLTCSRRKRGAISHDPNFGEGHHLIGWNCPFQPPVLPESPASLSSRTGAALTTGPSAKAGEESSHRACFP